ncbi:hypothetical protein H6G20_01220 [Desertifilum sp. FACHB-1129]|uniref:Uncharacterized protein n=3 Tax=Cyanophyceae TaxID=3028117 RepID=A0A1E5QG54_9CYAN|nr:MULTISPECIES: hypothetical protein [Cyanophyceae]MCD8489334.1 hypothetical protein [Desertifilum sp.]MDA0210356.1 hypothetical protein [Cyanobacteria bacterium FC1]NES94704.1 hypothetical protein [Desertifilum sp. SIO1I2]MBD2310303.1 hypothetical protein [Desertifilum sp. FACHB-1129]MBD2322679.1 hypothetical protein [Desertifilum sp. FACHB-866]
MSNPLQRIIPLSPPEAHEFFQVHQVSHAFYEEVKHREELERYAQWYALTAQQHQRELEQMRGEFNLFRLFSRRR